MEAAISGSSECYTTMNDLYTEDSIEKQYRLKGYADTAITKHSCLVKVVLAVGQLQVGTLGH